MVVRKFIDKGNRTTQFMLRPGEGRWCLRKALRTVPGSAATILLKAVSKTLETNQVLHNLNGTPRNTLRINVTYVNSSVRLSLTLLLPALF